MIRVLIVNEGANYNENWKPALQSQPDVTLVGEVPHFLQAVERLDQCDVLLVSATLPDDGACHLTRVVSRHEACVQILIWGQSSTSSHVLRFLEAGALGYISAQAHFDELLNHVRLVYRGHAMLPPELAGILLDRLAELSAWVEDLGPDMEHTRNLTRREREILYLIGRNFTNQDIANHLIIEVGTVKNHVHNILAKLKVSSRQEAANYLTLLRHQPLGTRRPARKLEPYRPPSRRQMRPQAVDSQ